jgi:hypothetical protein
MGEKGGVIRGVLVLLGFSQNVFFFLLTDEDTPGGMDMRLRVCLSTVCSVLHGLRSMGMLRIFTGSAYDFLHCVIIRGFLQATLERRLREEDASAVVGVIRRGDWQRVPLLPA